MLCVKTIYCVIEKIKIMFIKLLLQEVVCTNTVDMTRKRKFEKKKEQARLSGCLASRSSEEVFGLILSIFLLTYELDTGKEHAVYFTDFVLLLL